MPIVRSVEEVLDKMSELAKMSFVVPNGVFDCEKKEWEWYMKGGISMGRWLLGEQMGVPINICDYLKIKKEE